MPQVFMCFLIDEDCNKASGKYLASKELRDMIDGAQKEADAKKGTEMSTPAAVPAAN
jgi:hypothetical protein